MDKSKKKGISRRDFLMNTTKTVVIAGCLKVGLRDAIALAMETGKPVATEKNINSFIQNSTKNKGGYERIVKEASVDLRSFVMKNFTLTPEYEKNLKAIPDYEIEKFQKIIAMSIKEDKLVKVWYIPKGTSIAKGWVVRACLKVGWGEVCISYETKD